MTEFISVNTTTATKLEAQEIAEALVTHRLAACAQVSGPIESVYRWQGDVEHAAEWFCTAKTHKSLFHEVEARIRSLHSYECPEITALPIAGGSADYLAWLNDQLTEERPADSH